MKIYHFFLGLLTVGTLLTSCGKDNDEPNGQPKPSTENNTNKNIVTSGLPSEITLLEFPKVKGDSNNPIIVHKVNEEVNFSLEWDNAKRAQRWTCYQMTATNQVARWKRQNWKNTEWKGDPFQVDPLINRIYQTDGNDHANDGYDRGHICPSQDRVNSQEANMQTFYYSNMQPQLNGFNAGVWEVLETKIRSWVTANSPQSDILYVCKGGIIDGTQGTDYIMSNRKLIVPNHFFCALLMKNSSGYKAIGFWFEHKVNKDKNLSKYAVNVHELEQLTKLDFFCNLDDKTEKDVENLELTRVKNAWGL